MTKHCKIPFETRLDVHEGRADKEVTDLVSRHIAENCAECKKDQAWFEAFLPALHFALQTSEQRVSELARLRAQSIMPAALPSRAMRLVTAARMLFDSRHGGAEFAPARAGTDGSVHVVYRTDAADVDLWQEQTRDGDWYLTGQALANKGSDLEPPISATLMSSALPPQTAIMENSEFSFELVAAGRYSLNLTWDQHEITVNDLEIGFAEAV